MVRKATNAAVSDIEVEIDRPNDRAGKNDHIRSDEGTLSISGSGGTTTVVTNNSDGDWYLEGVSIHALASAGVVRAEIQVRDSGDTVLARHIGDGSGSYLPFNGQIVKPGWDVFADVDQSDSNSYTVNIYPQFRKPSAGSTPSGGASTEQPTWETIDGFESGGISSYTGDTGEFTVVSDPTYTGSNALRGDNTANDVGEIVSTSGLDRYFKQGEKARAWVRATDISTDPDNVRTAVGYGAADTSNYYRVQCNFDETDNVYLQKVSGGSVTNLDGPVDVSGNFEADTWFRVEIEWSDDDSHTAKVYSGGGSTALASLTATDNEHTGNDGIAFKKNTAASSSNVFFDQLEVTDDA